MSGLAGCSQIRLTSSGVFDDATGVLNAAGLMTLDDDAPVGFTSAVATLDADWDRAFAGKNFKATQREEITLQNGDQLYMEGAAISVPTSTPALWEATFSGKFVGGTGQFEGAHGNVNIKGLTMYAPGVSETSIARYLGEVCS